MEAIWRDLRLTLRGLAQRPLFTLVAVITLALGIGANTAVFSAIRAALLRDLPYEELDRLVYGRRTQDGQGRSLVSGPDYYDYREHSRSFESLAAVLFSPMNLTVAGEERPERVSVLLVSFDLFSTLGVAPALGRHFTAEEGKPGAPGVVMISHGYWQRRFGASPDVLGRPLVFSGDPHTIVGVMPAGFRFRQDVDVWAPMQPNGPYADVRRFTNWHVVGRLKPGVSIEEAQAEIDAISKRLEETYPETHKGRGLGFVPIRDIVFEDYGPRMLTLLAAVAALLMIACGNVGGLLLARGTARRAEFAMRAALGASRARLVRLVLTESLALALLGGAAGVGLAFLARRLLASALHLEGLGVTRLDLDAPVLLVAVGISILAAFLSGMLPALRATPAGLIDELKGGSRVAGPGRGSRLRSGLVVAQVALSSALLITSGLLLKNFLSLLGTDPGFDTQNLLAAEIELPWPKYQDRAERMRVFTSLMEEVRAIPEVAAAGLISQMPLRDPGNDVPLWAAERPPVQEEDRHTAHSRAALPGYFEAMRIPILSGRGIEETDTAESRNVVVISRLTARTLFPGEEALGRQIAVDFGGESPTMFEVVGVVGDVRVNWIGSEPHKEFYYAYAQLPRHLTMRIAVRSAADPVTVAAALRRTAWGIDKEILVERAATMRSVIRDSLVPQATIGLMVAFFGLVGLLLAALGLYGLLSFHVTLRYHEIGIRMALGSSPPGIFRLVARGGMGLALAGAGIGLMGAAGTVRLLSSLLVGMGPFDPAVFLGAPAVLLATALLACWIPARRAASLEPMIVLRME